MDITTTILIGVITSLLGILIGKISNAKKIDLIYEKLIRLDERFANVNKAYKKQEELFNRMRDVETDVEVCKNKLRIK